LPDTAAVRAALAAEPDATPPERADVRAARLGLAAAASDLARARSLYLPRINAFARLDWYSADAPFAGRDNWTAGIMATWTPFAGASQIAEMRAASGRAEAARAAAEAAEAQARLEVERSDIKRRVSLARLDIARAAVVQSAEAHRIVAQKYEGGLATVVELLDAAAVETSSGLGLSFAIYEAIVAEAERRQARGLDVGALGMLEKQPTVSR
jgi:outer membrane protein TolC